MAAFIKSNSAAKTRSSRRGFAPFAWYRIVAGTVLLAAILIR